jgi:hypothetical protein
MGHPDRLPPGLRAKPPPAWLFAAGFPVDELAINFPPQRVDHGYLKIEVVTQALVAKMPGEHPAVRDRFNVAIERDSSPVFRRNAIFHIEEKCLHRRHLVCSVDRFLGGKSPKQVDDLKRFAEPACLVLNDRYRAFQYNGSPCGRRARIDEHNQLADMGS